MVSSFVKQLWVTSAVLINMMGQGLVLSYTSCLLPGLRAPDSPIKVDLATASWLASIVGTSNIVGFLVCSCLMDTFGRRLTHALVIVPGAVGWLLIYFGQDITTLMCGRACSGFTAGGTVILGAIVIGEYTSPKNRGMLLGMKTAAVCVGNTVVHILGYYLHWRNVALLSLIPYGLALAINCTWPESPAWLASKGRFDESRKAFIWLRGTGEQAKSELEQMIKSQEARYTQTRRTSLTETLATFFKKFTKKDFIKPVIIVAFAALLLESCGRHIFPAYAHEIVGEIIGSQAGGFYFTITIDMITTISATSSSILIRRYKRRTVLFCSGVASLLLLATVCTYLLLSTKHVISNDQTWVPLSLFALYFVMSNLGCNPISLSLLGEVFPLAHRAAGSAVSGISMSLALMLALKLTPYMLVSLNVYGTFAVLGSVMTVALIALFFILPETKDRTLQEIEYWFNNGKFSDDEKVADEEEAKKMLT